VSQPLPIIQPVQATTWQMYRAMVGVGLLCGLLIVTVYQVTLPVITRNEAAALERAIFQVLPDARVSATFRLDEEDDRFEELGELEGPTAGGRLVYAGYDDAGQLVGLAIEAEGMGYADVIRVLYGYSFTRDAIVGIRVLASKETPGLGDRIETDASFLENFVRLDASPAPDGAGLANPIILVKPGEKTNPWEVDGITGATISSAAIADLLNQSASFWIPRVQRRAGDFREGA
jgi:electron transport complex protein RnfG